MHYGIILIVAGLLAAPKLIAGKSKHAEDALKKFAPYQGWLGFGIFFWGIWGVVTAILNLDLLSSGGALWWITLVAVSALEIILGLLLGFNLINQYAFSKNPELEKKGKMIHQKLVPKQTFFGLLGVALGVWTLIAHFVF